MEGSSLWLIGAFAATVLLVLYLLRRVAALKRRERERRKADGERQRYFEENDLGNTANQLRFVAQSRLRAVPPVNREAVQVLYALDDWIADHRPDWRVSFEVAMGAFVKTSYNPRDRRQRAAFSSYNSKRVDFLLVDRLGNPALVVEYHGTGHDLSGDADDRMAVKRLVLKRAGIPLVEVPAGATKRQVLHLIAEELGP
ncbi:DUF2726 domain-containing protein [Aureimonas psammosilenae]|uniref:DUF2726 domain-containing protein n=1 Tax=Aureimonas psammosilenae TaxID=2495496 RepID=UPI001AED41AD|nr:DUF2726 domain-containing protein [Aureimonas psammosilenae]